MAETLKNKQAISTNNKHTDRWLWDSSPKLLQILNTIDFSPVKDGFMGIAAFRKEKGVVALKEPYQFDKNQAKNDTYFSDLLEGFDTAQLIELLQQATHWLNTAEIEFIAESWYLKEKRFNDLKKERDDALRMVRANANVVKALQIAKKDPTLALRMAQVNYSLYPESSAASSVFAELNSSPKAKIQKTIKTGHSNTVTVVAFSPDSKTILTGSKDYTAKLWDLKGNELQRFQHNSQVLAVTFSPDGQSILTGDSNQEVKLWDLQGNVLYDFIGHKGAVTAVAFSFDERYILTGSEDKMVIVWDLKGNIQISFSFKSAIHSLASSPVENSLLFTQFGNTVLVKIQDNIGEGKGLQGNVLQNFSRNKWEIYAVAFSPDGKQILTGSRDFTAHLWDVKGAFLTSFVGHAGSVLAVAFSPDGKSILTGSADRTAMLWDLRGNVLQSFQVHTQPVSSVAFSPDGKYILTGSEDHTAKLWDLNGYLSYDFHHSFVVDTVVLSPSGKQIFLGGEWAEDKLRDLKGNVLRSFTHSCAISNVIFSPDGKYILICYKDYLHGHFKSSMNLHDLQGYGNMWYDFDPQIEISAVTFSPDSKKILTGFKDHSIKLWDLEGNEKNEGNGFEGHSGPVTAVAFSSDGRYILTGSKDKAVKLWDLKGNLLQNFEDRHTSTVLLVAFSLDGKQILTVSQDTLVKLSDLQGNVLQNIINPSNNVHSVAYSPNLDNILIGSTNNTAELWDLKGNKLHSFPHNSNVTTVAFSANGQNILTVSKDRAVKLWLNPMDFLNKKVETYSKSELNEHGLNFTEEDWKNRKDWFKEDVYQPLYFDFDTSIASLDSAKLSLAGTYFYAKKEWEKASLLYIKSVQQKPSLDLFYKLAELAEKQNTLFDFQNFLDLKLKSDLRKAGDYFYIKEMWENAILFYQKAKKKGVNLTAKIMLCEYKISIKQGKPLGINHFLQNDNLADIKTIIDYFRPKDFNATTKRKKEYLKKYTLIYPLLNHAITLGIDSKTNKQFANDANQYAYFQLLNGDFIGAEKSARKGIEFNEKTIALHTKIAPALLFQGKYEAAQKEFERVAAQPYDNKTPNYATKFLAYFKLFEAEKIIPEAHRPKMEEIKTYLENVVAQQKR